MATTDARPGFRLPWSSDQRQQTDDDSTALVAETTDADAHTSDAPVAAADVDAPAEAVAEAVVEAAADAAETWRAPEEPSAIAPDPVVAPAPLAATPAAAKRPNKFLADLTRAMQAAAEGAREETLTRFQAEAKTYVEEIHSRSAEGATELRQRADDDIAGIRDWSKAEIARIREETERKIATRKSDLEEELEAHAARIEREIERIQGRVGEFEKEMGTFFERLLVEEDPTRFAAMAESLPEPPAFDFATAFAGTTRVVEPEPVVEAVAEPGAVAPVEAPVADPWADAPWSVEPPVNPEAAYAAIQEAAELAEAAERAGAAFAPVEDGTADADMTVAADVEAAEAVASVDDEVGSVEAAVADIAAEDDPRLAALGLAPDFAAAAEAEAAEAAGSGNDTDEIPLIEDDALAARLAGLVPSSAPAPTESLASSQVIVTGLISVASIASFKRHLGRMAGVQSVGVSSGPDGEFIFTVAHADDVVLTDAIPTLPGFQARVTGTTDGVVNVSAHDPESAA